MKATILLTVTWAAYIKSPKITTNYNKGKACKIELKYFTVRFINSCAWFYIKFPRRAYNFLLSMWLTLS